jgi:hypothetical protein
LAVELFLAEVLVTATLRDEVSSDCTENRWLYSFVALHGKSTNKIFKEKGTFMT